MNLEIDQLNDENRTQKNLINERELKMKYEGNVYSNEQEKKLKILEINNEHLQQENDFLKAQN